jgi:hypothetical protein
MNCARATEVGTTLFSDRRSIAVEGGDRLFLCADCNERAVSQYGRRPTDADLRQIAARGEALGTSDRVVASTGADLRHMT